MTNGMGSALLVPELRLPALPAVSPTPASQQDSRVPLPASGDDCDVSMDLTEFADIFGVLEEDARSRAQAWRLEQTLESSAEQRFGSLLVEYERNMVKRSQQEAKANRAEITSALETGGEQCPVGCPGKRCLRTARYGPEPDGVRGIRWLPCAHDRGDTGAHSRPR